MIQWLYLIYELLIVSSNRESIAIGRREFAVAYWRFIKWIRLSKYPAVCRITSAHFPYPSQLKVQIFIWQTKTTLKCQKETVANCFSELHPWKCLLLTQKRNLTLPKLSPFLRSPCTKCHLEGTHCRPKHEVLFFGETSLPRRVGWFRWSQAKPNRPLFPNVALCQNIGLLHSEKHKSKS